MCTHFHHFTSNAINGTCEGQNILAVDSDSVTFQETFQRVVPIAEVDLYVNQMNQAITNFQADHTTDISILEANITSYSTVTS